MERMGFNLKIKCYIDSGLVERAEQEAFQILLGQRLSFNDRWYARPIVKRLVPILGNLGLLLSILGIIVSLYTVVVRPGWCPAALQVESLIVFFIFAGFLFYYFPSVDRAIKNWVKNISIKGCKKLARKCVKAARKAAPFQAEYDIKDDLITYYRGNDVWVLAWSRRLKGVAVHGESTTLFFRKWRSIQPIMVVLHEDFSSIAEVLNDQGIEFKSIK